MIDEKGRCCGRKPLVYKRWPHRGYCCIRCHKQYDLDTKLQMENWAWIKVGEEWVRKS